MNLEIKITVHSINMRLNKRTRPWYDNEKLIRGGNVWENGLVNIEPTNNWTRLPGIKMGENMHVFIYIYVLEYNLNASIWSNY